MTRALSIVAVVVLIVVFAAINWSAVTAPTRLSLGVATVDAPIGLVMLALVVILCVLFATWAVTLQARAMAETRRHTKDLQAQRELADSAEASRFVELRADLLARMDQLEGQMRAALEESSNSLAATIGELDDRLQRGGGPSL
jgi:uncharacterized integral membrane protein